MTKEEKRLVECIKQEQQRGELNWQRGGPRSLFPNVHGITGFTVWRNGQLIILRKDVERVPGDSETTTFLHVYAVHSETGASDELPEPEFVITERKNVFLGKLLKFWNMVNKKVVQAERRVHEAEVAEVASRICQPA